ncbi:hypothetical protein [Ideonella dechloratans]|uniref:hypothetical protein n=1 Tax=Ideonella dechloratans TaxID=36863 RepID=UPI0035B22C50
MPHSSAFRTRLAALFGGLILAAAPLAHARVEPANASGDTAVPAPALQPSKTSNPPKVHAKAHAPRQSTPRKTRTGQASQTTKVAKKAGSAKATHTAKHGARHTTAHASAKPAPKHDSSRTLAKAHGGTTASHAGQHHAKARTQSVAKAGSGHAAAHHHKPQRDRHTAPSHA